MVVVGHVVRRVKLEYLMPTGQIDGRRAVVDIALLVGIKSQDLIVEMQR